MEKTKTYTELFDDPSFIPLFTAFKSFMLPFETPMIQTITQILTPFLLPTVGVLEIGFGDGQITHLFLKFLSETKQISSYNGLERSSTLHKQGDVRIHQLCEKYMLYDLYCMNIAAEQYNRSFFNTYQLIISINSWYGIDFDEILRYRRALKKDGVLAIFISSKNSLTTWLTNQLCDNTESIKTDEDIEEYLQEQDICFTSHQIYIPKLGRNEFFTQSPGSDEWQIKPEAEGFFRYMLRKPTGEIQSLLSGVLRLPDYYFRCYETLFLIKNKT